MNYEPSRPTTKKHSAASSFAKTRSIRIFKVSVTLHQMEIELIHLGCTVRSAQSAALCFRLAISLRSKTNQRSTVYESGRKAAPFNVDSCSLDLESIARV